MVDIFFLGNHQVDKLNSMYTSGGLMYSTWAWNMMCAPDIFSWTFGFTFLNICQVLYDIYRIRPVRLDPEVETVFTLLFQPLGVYKHESFILHFKSVYILTDQQNDL